MGHCRSVTGTWALSCYRFTPLARKYGYWFTMLKTIPDSGLQGDFWVLVTVYVDSISTLLLQIRPFAGQ